MIRQRLLRQSAIATVAGALALLVGCDGGDDNKAPAISGPPVSATWEPGRSLAGILLGDSYATVTTKVGAPSEVRQTSNGDGKATLWSDFASRGLSISYRDNNGNLQLDDDEVVDGLFSHSFSGITPPSYSYQGITFGSSYAAAVAVLGSPSRTLRSNQPTNGSGSIWWLRAGVSLIFSKDAMDFIFVFRPINLQSVIGVEEQMRTSQLEAFVEHCSTQSANP
jgi:hypothetical protein